MSTGQRVNQSARVGNQLLADRRGGEAVPLVRRFGSYSRPALLAFTSEMMAAFGDEALLASLEVEQPTP